jgi:hypothetical protein
MFVTAPVAFSRIFRNPAEFHGLRSNRHPAQGGFHAGGQWTRVQSEIGKRFA